MCYAGMDPPSPSQRPRSTSAGLPDKHKDTSRQASSPQNSVVEQNVENKLRQLEQLQYDLTKQVEDNVTLILSLRRIFRIYIRFLVSVSVHVTHREVVGSSLTQLRCRVQPWASH